MCDTQYPGLFSNIKSEVQADTVPMLPHMHKKSILVPTEFSEMTVVIGQKQGLSN